MANKFVEVVEEYLINNNMSDRDYHYLIGNTKWILYNYHLLIPSIDYVGITNQFLIDIKESNYDSTLSEWEKKNYINLFLLYSAQKVMAVSRNNVDIPPYMIKEYYRYINWANNLTEKQLYDMRNAMADVSLDIVWMIWYREEGDSPNKKFKDHLDMKIILETISQSLTHKEKVILANYYKHWLSKKEIGKELWVTWERARQIINSSIEKCKRNIERYKDTIV